jgi:hypothetical protein
LYDIPSINHGGNWTEKQNSLKLQRCW